MKVGGSQSPVQSDDAGSTYIRLGPSCPTSRTPHHGECLLAGRWRWSLGPWWPGQEAAGGGRQWFGGGGRGGGGGSAGVELFQGVAGRGLFFGGRPCDHAFQQYLCPRFSSSTAVGYSCYVCRDKYPQCKLCSTPSRFLRCRSWTGY